MSVGHEPAPGLSLMGRRHLEDRRPPRSARRAQEPHTAVLHEPGALSPVALHAGEHAVLPGGLAAARARQDVIDGEVRRGGPAAAVLTALLVAIACTFFSSLVWFAERGEWDDEAGIWFFNKNEEYQVKLHGARPVGNKRNCGSKSSGSSSGSGGAALRESISGGYTSTSSHLPSTSVKTTVTTTTTAVKDGASTAAAVQDSHISHFTRLLRASTDIDNAFDEALVHAAGKYSCKNGNDDIPVNKIGRAHV